MKKILFLSIIILFIFFGFLDYTQAEYKKNDNNAFYGIEIITEADISTFEILDREYSLDKNYVYFRGEIISEADPSSFERIFLPYSKDNNNVYYYETKILGADPKTIIVLKGSYYTKDKNNVYYKTDILENADTSTFKMIHTNLDDYAKDINNYYKDGEIIVDDKDLLFAKRHDSEYINDPLIERVRGKILLQVEQNGEAWYVSPGKRLRYYLGTPQDAFDIMRNFGGGMSNRDFEKIPVADMNLSNGPDNDNDGLSNQAEDAFGTDKENQDSDNDGFNDREEILSGYDPTGNSKLDIDYYFVEGRKGKIYLQVEQNGEAWYIYPDNSKRYFLGRPKDAFEVMRNLGLGITDNDLSRILASE